MFTPIHTTEWNYSSRQSTDKKNFYNNRVNGNWLCEYKTNLGFEYYLCTEEQAMKQLLGEYIGCFACADSNRDHMLVKDHETEREFTWSFNDEKYLD